MESRYKLTVKQKQGGEDKVYLFKPKPDGALKSLATAKFLQEFKILLGKKYPQPVKADESFIRLLHGNLIHQSLQPVLHVDQAFMGFKKALDELQEKVNSDISEERIDRSFFEVEDRIAQLRANAVGCRSCCPFCGRKCQM